MVSRLLLAGIRSISLTVDISNYVMLELGQPIHAYDLGKVVDGLVVRRAAKGEKLETLDGKVRVLDQADLVVADGKGAVGLAGVMGGARTEISTETTDVLVEAGIWDPITIARSVRRHKLPSEAAKRYERGVDPAMSAAGVARVMQLLVELASGVIDPEGFHLDESVAPAVIHLPENFIRDLVGVDFSADEISASLAAIGATVEFSEVGWDVTPPTWRPDLTHPATLAEEVARLVGYDRIPSELPVAPPGRGLSRAQRLRRTASNSLASAGLTEVLAYPFVSQTANDLFGSPVQGVVAAMKLANALDPDAAFMRTSLLPGLIAVARRNLSRGLTNLAVFEVGTVFLPATDQRYGSGPLPDGDSHPGDDALAALRASIPPQPWHVGALFVGDAVTKQPGQAAIGHGVADAIATARHLAATLAVELRVVTGTHQAMHPGRTAELRVGERLVGFAGELLPTIAADLDLPRIVGVLELDLDALIELGATEIAAQPIASFPAATQDLSLVVSQDVAAGHVVTQPAGAQASVEGWFVKHHGAVRRIEVTTYSFAAAAHLVVGTDRIATVHARLARQAEHSLPIVVLPPPMEVPRMQQAMQWHKYRTQDPGLMWLRGLLHEAVRRMNASGNPG